MTLDTTRADRLGCYGKAGAGTPVLDGLAERGVRFGRAYAQAPITLPSHVSIMTGLLPSRAGVHVNGQVDTDGDPSTLAGILSDNGFSTVAAVGGFPLAARYPVSRGFEEYDDRMVDRRNPEGVERDAGDVVKAALDLLKGAEREKILLWVHMFDPHDPYEPPEEYLHRFPDDPYQGEIARVDHALGELLEGFRDLFPADEPLICIVGDHGEALGEHGEQTHGFFLYDSTVRVPLIIVGPGVPAGTVHDPPVQTVDILPTLLSLLGIRAPAGLDGNVIDFEGRSDQTYPIVMETEIPLRNYGWSRLTAVVDGNLKYISAPREELYDLHDDPGETHNLATSRHDDVSRLRQLLRLHWTAGSGGAITPDPRLVALGYVDNPTPPGTESALQDPKDHLDEYIVLQSASMALENGKPQVALDLLETLPAWKESAGVRFKHAVALRMLGRLHEAEAELEGLDPSFPGLALEHARIAIALKRPTEALEYSDRQLEQFPDHTVALLIRGASLEMLGNAAAAETDYRAAIKVNPAYRNASLRLAALLVRSGRTAEASSVLRRHLQFHPEDELASGLLREIQ